MMSGKEEQWVLNVSDVHFDSRKCDRKLFKKHLDQALERDAWILINGDFLDVMGAKKDPRSIPSHIRPEYMKDGRPYFDLVIEDAVKFLTPYVKNIKILGYGNHETNIVKRQEFDPMKYLHDYLNRVEGADIQLSAYNGATICKFQRTKQGCRYIKKIFHHHGFGGNAQRSKGILSADLLVAQNPWADIITSGHDHQKWSLPYTIRTLNVLNDTWERRRIDIVRSGSYKMKSDDFGWEVEKNFMEPTLGGFWIKFRWEWIRSKNTHNLVHEIHEAY